MLQKTCFQRAFEFIKKNFIGNERSGTVTKVKLVTKIKTHNQLYFGTLVFIDIVEIARKIRTSFKTLTSKKATTWRLKNSQSNDKLL